MTHAAHYLQIAPDAVSLPALPGTAPFRVVVLVREPVSPLWRDRVSAWLVDSGCQYMLAWGVECSAWDDAVDWANLERFVHGTVPEDRSVTTTWHEDETVDEVFFFARHLATLPGGEAGTTVILDIASEASMEETLAAWRRVEEIGG